MHVHVVHLQASPLKPNGSNTSLRRYIVDEMVGGAYCYWQLCVQKPCNIYSAQLCGVYTFVFWTVFIICYNKAKTVCHWIVSLCAWHCCVINVSQSMYTYTRVRAHGSMRCMVERTPIRFSCYLDPCTVNPSDRYTYTGILIIIQSDIHQHF